MEVEAPSLAIQMPVRTALTAFNTGEKGKGKDVESHETVSCHEHHRHCLSIPSDRTRILVYLRLLKSHLNVGHMEKSSYIIALSQFLEFGHRQSISSITSLPRCIRLARLHSRLRRPYHRPPARPFEQRGLLNGLQHWMRRGDTTVQEV